MSLVYVFEASVVRLSKGRYVIYPPKEYQERLEGLHGRKVKVIVVAEPTAAPSSGRPASSSRPSGAS
jgi:hypothetical protein